VSVEIERKYLVNGDGWKIVEPVYLCQGYLNTDKARTVRVRVAETKAFLTIKGKTTGVSRPEFEYPIPLEDARELLLMCTESLIEKRRYSVPIEGLIWEIDEFMGSNKGLLVAEVELQSEHQKVNLPAWIGKEVSGDTRYFNSALASMPYSLWEENAAE